jgi:peroxiredoxin
MSELHGLQLKIDEFEAAGYRVVAVSPDTVEENQQVARRLRLDYPILSDADLQLTDALGLRHEGAAMDGGDIPRPATFIALSGAIRWRDLTDNWRVRIRADDLLREARELAGL